MRYQRREMRKRKEEKRKESNQNPFIGAFCFPWVCLAYVPSSPNVPKKESFPSFDSEGSTSPLHFSLAFIQLSPSLKFRLVLYLCISAFVQNTNTECRKILLDDGGDSVDFSLPYLV
jgi:hypothetical protein